MSDCTEDRGHSGNEPIGPTLEEGMAPAAPNYSLSRTIEQSRRLIRESQRIIAESYRFESRQR